VRPPQSSATVSHDQADLPSTSSRNLTFVIPDDSMMQSASFPVNSVASQIPGAIPNNRFVPLTLPRAPRAQNEPMSDLCQGTMPAYTRQKINRPEAPHDVKIRHHSSRSGAPYPKFHPKAAGSIPAGASNKKCSPTVSWCLLSGAALLKF
jgi:hypothetical protein